MTVNVGAYPLDATTLIGQTRLLFGDMVSVPLIPLVGGQQSYGYFSDAELGAFLAVGGSNPLMATGFAYLAVAGQVAASVNNVSIKSLDFAVDPTKRAADLRGEAQKWFDLANNVEQFHIGDTGARRIDIRDYMLPTGLIAVSDIFWAETSTDGGATWLGPQDGLSLIGA